MNDRVLTEKDFPIQRRWLLRVVLIGLFIILLAFFWPSHKKSRFIFDNLYDWTIKNFIEVFLFLSSLLIVPLLCLWLQRKYFVFSLGEDFWDLKQGVIAKQNMHVSYGRLQHIVLSQDVIDRILGLVTVTVENAGAGHGDTADANTKGIWGWLGFYKNKIVIPGLTRVHAERLRELLLQKMKEHPFSQDTSGL